MVEPRRNCNDQMTAAATAAADRQKVRPSPQMEKRRVCPINCKPKSDMGTIKKLFISYQI